LVYAKYIKRKGKRFGPYYYKSIRDENGNVRNIYVGRTLPKEKPEKHESRERHFKFDFKFPKSASFKFSKPRKPQGIAGLENPAKKIRQFNAQFKRFYPIVTLLILIFAAFSFIEPVPTGFMAADLQTSAYSPGEVLGGFVGMGFGSQELIPQDAKIVVSVANQSKTIGLDDFISISGAQVPSGSGSYHKSGTSLAGSGPGYGLEGEKTG
jgi:hypothetical protein